MKIYFKDNVKIKILKLIWLSDDNLVRKITVYRINLTWLLKLKRSLLKVDEDIGEVLSSDIESDDSVVKLY